MIYKLGNTLSLRNPKIIEANIILFDSIQFDSQQQKKLSDHPVFLGCNYLPASRQPPSNKGRPGAQAFFPYILLITA
jgi:hypothetical protein